MFARPSEILKMKEGALAETPLPLLLHSLLLEERSCTLELKLHGLVKRIVIEEGSPVDCHTNLLHETIGKFLVERGKLQEPQYQEALVESVTTGQKMGELLVKKGLISPFDLFKQLQANLAHKILDCFRWGDARFRVLGDVEAAESPVKMNPVQLILTGSSNFLPFDLVASHLTFADEQRFALVPDAPHEVKDLKLSPKEARMLQLLRTRPTFEELMTRSGLEMEEALRRLYAFCVLGMADFAEAVKAAPAEPVKPEPAPAPEPAPPEPTGLPFLDEDEATRNALVQAFLEHRSKDPFELLGVKEDVQLLPLRKAFLAASERFPPARFRTNELREKAEALLVAYARAYGALVEPEQLTLHRKRRQLAAEAKKAAPRPSTTEQFRIQTDLLDAGSQFATGKDRLASNNPKAALEYFQYAYEIEPKETYRAYLAWTRYLINPGSYARLALQELAEAVRKEPGCEQAHYFAGEIHRAEGHYDQAAESFRQAYKANPKNRKYADLAHEMIRLKKKP